MNSEEASRRSRSPRRASSPTIWSGTGRGRTRRDRTPIASMTTTPRCAADSLPRRPTIASCRSTTARRAGVRADAKQFADYREQAAKKDGIDLVVGHHAHVVRGVEIAGKSLIFYGLGNFLHQGTADITGKGVCRDWGLMARVHLKKQADGKLALRAVEAIPVTDTHFRPRPLTGAAGGSAHPCAQLSRCQSRCGIRRRRLHAASQRHRTLLPARRRQGRRLGRRPVQELSPGAPPPPTTSEAPSPARAAASGNLHVVRAPAHAPSVVLGLVLRTTAGAGASGDLGPRHKAEDDSGGKALRAGRLRR